MATHPTKAQDRACTLIADALLAVAEAARFDGKARLEPAGFARLAAELARASSAFGLDEIASRALDARGRALGLRSGTAELLTLLDDKTPPLELLLLDDDAFRARVAAVEAELGDV